MLTIELSSRFMSFLSIKMCMDDSSHDGWLWKQGSGTVCPSVCLSMNVYDTRYSIVYKEKATVD